MSTCARCGEDDCEAEWGRKEALECRDRELANLRSLLRSVTGKLEEAAAELEGQPDDPIRWLNARALVDIVLEKLS
jgi:hypothetical protein